MKGDFSRLTFDKEKQFSRVLMQQGRVQLDADWNEQVAIFLESIRTLTRDVIGPHGGTTDTSFKIEPGEKGFLIKKGRYYVQGIGCINDDAQAYDQQKNYPLSESEKIKAGMYLVYLDVWERHVSVAEDDCIREVALGGAETTSRGQVIWQVKTLRLDDKDADHVRSQKRALQCMEKAEAVWPRNPQGVQERRKQFARYALQEVLNKQLRNKSNVQLRSRVKRAYEFASDANREPEFPYRGIENQLYRVEIHRGTAGEQPGVTFKWSRDNGSFACPIQAMAGLNVTLSYFGTDSRGGLNIDDWVEIVDDRDVLRGVPGVLHQIENIDLRGMDTLITLKANAGPERQYGEKDPYHPVLRRWDHSDRNGELNDGAVLVREKRTDDAWIELENGIEIQFSSQTNGKATEYRSGDYWLIPARTAKSDIEWPQTIDGNGKSTPAEQEPFGIDHHYAPLAFITSEDDGRICVEHDCRYVVTPIGLPVGPPLRPPVGLNVLALTLAGALLGVVWFGVEYLPKYLPIGTDSFLRLFIYTGIGGIFGFVLSSLYNVFLQWLAPSGQSQE
ncbi:MAG: DUF6519 domain-containing protein [Nitrospira sp.]|nr:DUF6519 domain-containing protein [Nitrospira sp.]